MRTQIGTAMLTMLTMLAGFALAGCGIDDTLKSPPPESPEAYTVLVNVQPPSSLRTEETWGSWTIPVQAGFRTDFGTSAEDGHAEGGDHGHASRQAGAEAHEIFIGRSVLEGFGIAVEAEPAEAVWAVEHDGPEMHMPADGETHHLKVHLEDALSGHHPHGNSNIPGAKVHLEVEVNGEEQEIELRPVQGGHGFRYEANASIPRGVYDMKVHVTPPNFLRSTATKDRWTEEVEAELPGYDLSGEGGSASVEVDGMKISVRAGASKVYGAFGMGYLPLRGDETMSFSVRLEDTATPASGAGEMIAHCWVGVTVIDEETGASLSKTLSPIYGEHGFYYGANISLPKGKSVVGITETGGEGHSDLGHSH